MQRVDAWAGAVKGVLMAVTLTLPLFLCVVADFLRVAFWSVLCIRLKVDGALIVP